MTTDRQAINAFIPMLRRHARMLIGYRDIADRLILGLLAAPIPGAEAAASPRETRLALYRAFARALAATNWMAFATAPRSIAESVGGADAPPIPGLLSLSLIRRQVVLLADVEKFSFSDIAYILEISEESAKRHFAEAQAALAAAAPARVMIIEDDRIIAMDLAFMVEEAGHEVVVIAARENEAVERGLTAKPDIILSDIQLEDGGNGLEAVRRITAASAVPVIFITAFPERLLTGDGLEPTFVITKPYDPATVRTALVETLNLARSRPVAAIAAA